MPKKFIILRGFQLALGCILFGFGIFGIIFAPFSGIILTFVTVRLPSPPLSLSPSLQTPGLHCFLRTFDSNTNTHKAIVTITAAGYTIGSERSPHAKAYNYWAILGLEIFCVLFWLISFALVATVVGLVAATYYGGITYSGGYYDDYYGDVYSTKAKRAVELVSRGVLGKRYTDGYTAAVGIFGAAAGLGAAEFVLYVVSLVILSIRIHKHRKAGGHCKPGKGLPTSNTNLPGAPMQNLQPMQAAPDQVHGQVMYQPHPHPHPQQQQNTYLGGDYPEGKIELMPQTAVSPVSSPHSQSVTPVPNHQQQQQTYQQQGPGGYAQYQQ